MEPIELADRYVAVWNEPSREARRAAVRDLWAEDGVHRGEVTRVHDAVRLSWEAVLADSGEVAGWGTDFLLLNADGRIRADYQIVEA
jgi:hypothetical protein